MIGDSLSGMLSQYSPLFPGIANQQNMQQYSMGVDLHMPDAKFCPTCGNGLVERMKSGSYRYDAYTGEPIMVKECGNASCPSTCKHEFRLRVVRTCRCCGEMK